MQADWDGEAMRVLLTEEEQRELIKFLWENKPNMVREIVCENCPEEK